MSYEETGFNKHVGKESKCWGLPVVGLASGAITGMLILTKLELMFAIISSIGGFFVGAFVSKAWHRGFIQKWVYGNLPLPALVRSRYLPDYCSRRFM